MRLTLTKSEVLNDWYLIERAEHDGREWSERTQYGSRFCRSARICGLGGFSADIEGTAAEMRYIAAAIERRGEDSFRRCAVDARGALIGPVIIGSPRNDNGEPGECSLDEADELAAQIRAMLGRS